jgi:type IV pilus assembly protein PilF
MKMAMAAQGRFRAGWLAAAALAATLTAGLAGCATGQQQQQGAAPDMSVPTLEEPENRRRARIRLELASNYYAEGKTEIALDELRQVITVDPTLPDAYNLRGLIYMRLGDERQAEDSFRRTLSLNPRDADAAHNYGWLLCQMQRYPEAMGAFQQALSNPLYGDRPKTFMAQGLCQARAGQLGEAEQNLVRSYELDPGNPITGYNLARLLYQRGEFPRAQFYIRRINNSELANAETLWLGVKVENRLNDTAAMGQLSEQLRKRYPQSRERGSLDRRAFDE